MLLVQCASNASVQAAPSHAKDRFVILRPTRELSAVILLSTSTSLAAYLVGALAVQIRETLHLSLDGIGLAVAAYSLAAAVGLIPGGRLAERMGAVWTMRAAALCATIALLLLALWAEWLAAIAGFLVLAGFATAAMQPATNLFLVRRVRFERQGLAFGAKQAAIPLATMLAGLTVPTIGLTVGWRWAFVAGAVLAALAAFFGPSATSPLSRRPLDPVVLPQDPTSVVPLLVLAVGFGLGNLAATGLTTFVVSSAVANGIGKSTSGLIAVAGSLAAVLARVVAGVGGGHSGGDPLLVIVSMLFAGAVGYATIAAGVGLGIPVVFVVGVILAFGAGWGWNGLFFFTVARSFRGSPARATAAVQTGGQLAGMVGSITFALIVVHASFAVAWLSCSSFAIAAACVVLVSRRLLGRAVPEHSPTMQPMLGNNSDA
jgi:hypothetical protein